MLYSYTLKHYVIVEEFINDTCYERTGAKRNYLCMCDTSLSISLNLFPNEGPDNIRNPVLIRLPWAVKAKVPKETCRCGEATLYSNGRELWQRAAVSRRTGRFVVRERKCHGLNLNLLRKLVIYHKPLLLRKTLIFTGTGILRPFTHDAGKGGYV
jgi:hypothetical protein